MSQAVEKAFGAVQEALMDFENCAHATNEADVEDRACAAGVLRDAAEKLERDCDDALDEVLRTVKR